MIAAAAARGITMVEPQVYLEKLSAFSRMLRLEGLAIGPSETGDAAKILVSLVEKITENAVLRLFYTSEGEKKVAI